MALPLKLSALFTVHSYSCTLLINCFITSYLHTSAKVILFCWQFCHNSAKASNLCFHAEELMWPAQDGPDMQLLYFHSKRDYV